MGESHGCKSHLQIPVGGKRWNWDSPFPSSAGTQRPATSRRFSSAAISWKLVYVIAGKGSIEINGHEYLLSPGTVLFIHPESETRYRLAETKLEICNLCFLPELIEDRLEKLRDPSGFFSILRPGSSAPPEAVRNLCVQSAPPSVAGLFRKMEREYRSGRNNCREMLRTQLIELLLLLERNACRLRNRRAHRRPGASGRRMRCSPPVLPGGTGLRAGSARARSGA